MDTGQPFLTFDGDRTVAHNVVLAAIKTVD